MREVEDPSASVREQVELVRRVLGKRWRLMAFVAVIAGIAAFGTTMLLSPVYEATTSVRILREPGIDDLTSKRFDRSGGTLLAEANWFTSRQIVEGVVQRLALADGPPSSLLEAGIDRARGVVRRLLNRPEPENARFNEIVNTLREKSIKVKELEGSSVLEVKVSWHDPEMTMRIANTLVDVFIEQYKEFSRGRSRQNRTSLEQQVQLVAIRLKESENRLVEFQKKTGIVSGDEKGIMLPDRTGLEQLVREKRELELEKAAALAQLKGLEERLAGINNPKEEKGERFRSALGNPNSLIRILMSQVVTKESNVAGGSTTHGELAGLKARLREELNRLGADAEIASDDLMRMAKEEEQLASASANTLAQIQSERPALEGRIKGCEDRLAQIESETAQAEKEAQKLPDELRQFWTLTGEKRVDQDLYTMLSQRLAGAQVEENSDLSDIRVFDLAQTPLAPTKPKPLLLTLIGAFMGLLLGISLSFVMEYLDDTLHSSQEVLSYLGLPVLAEIPRVKVKLRKSMTSAVSSSELIESGGVVRRPGC